MRPLPIAAALVLLASTARAEDSVTVHTIDPRTGAEGKQGDSSIAYFTPGLLLSLNGGLQHAVGYGFEGSYQYYPYGRVPSLAYGGYAQLQLNDLKYLRTGVGAQVAVGVAGVQLGLGFRQGDGQYASTVSTDIGEFLTLGWVTMEIRESIATFALPASLPSYGFETGFSIKLAVPIAVRGDDPTGMAVRASGRGW